MGLSGRTAVYITADHGFDEGLKSHSDAPYVFLATTDKGVERRGLREDIAADDLRPSRAGEEHVLAGRWTGTRCAIRTRRRCGDRPARPDGERRSGEPRRIGEIIAPALDRLAGSDQARAYGAWARAAGEQVSGGARPRNFSRGTLTVECSSSVWANELTYLSAEILRRMDEVTPGHPVKKLRFMVASAPVVQEIGGSRRRINRRHARPAPAGSTATRGRRRRECAMNGSGRPSRPSSRALARGRTRPLRASTPDG